MDTLDPRFANANEPQPPAEDEPRGVAEREGQRPPRLRQDGLNGSVPTTEERVDREVEDTFPASDPPNVTRRSE